MPLFTQPLGHPKWEWVGWGKGIMENHRSFAKRISNLHFISKFEIPKFREKFGGGAFLKALA